MAVNVTPCHYGPVIVLKCEKKDKIKVTFKSVAFLLQRSAMPRLPKKPCRYPGCPNLTDETYCDKHKKLMDKAYEEHGRDKETKKRYGRNWARIRKRYVAAHPFCEECFKRGIIVPVDEVHHKVPLAEGGTHDEENLVSLCKSCHAKIHGKRGDYRGSKKHKVYSY